MMTYTCDLCGYSSDDIQTVAEHLRTVHDVSDPAEVGSIEQADGILTLRNSDETTTIDLAAWLAGLLDDEVSE